MRHWTTSAAPKALKRGLGHLMKDTPSTERTDAQLEQNKERNRIKSRRREKKLDGV